MHLITVRVKPKRQIVGDQKLTIIKPNPLHYEESCVYLNDVEEYNENATYRCCDVHLPSSRLRIDHVWDDTRRRSCKYSTWISRRWNMRLHGCNRRCSFPNRLKKVQIHLRITVAPTWPLTQTEGNTLIMYCIWAGGSDILYHRKPMMWQESKRIILCIAGQLRDITGPILKSGVGFETFGRQWTNGIRISKLRIEAVFCCNASSRIEHNAITFSQ